MINFDALDPNNKDRQHKTSTDPQELELREVETRGLIHDIVGRHAEYFAEPENRIDFLVHQDPEDFLRIAQYVNAKLRGEKPSQLRNDKNEGNGALPMMHTPHKTVKPEAFRRGFAEVQKYLEESDDDTEKKILGAAMAVEALMIWVHPFNDGNGRTSRFLAKMIESGATDIDDLIAQTSFKRNRGSYYRERYASRESEFATANDDDIILDDEERAEMRKKAEEMPPDVRAIPLSIMRLLNDEDVRMRALSYRKDLKKEVAA